MTTVFVDVDTQADFLYPAGALYVPGAEQVVAAVAALNRHAGARGIPLISTADAHYENDPEFRVWPAHCVAGTIGQQKPAVTLLDSRVVIPAEGTVRDFPNVRQFILEKLHNDAFTNANLMPLLTTLEAERYVVYGVVTEVCVRCAAMGLLATGKRTELVSDAVRSLEDRARDAFISEFTAGGGVLTTAAAVLG